MNNRIEKGLNAWHGRQQQYARIFGSDALGSRAFAKIRLQEMRQLYQQFKPPQNIDERVSLKMLRASNKSLERRLYPNRLFRITRRLAIAVFRLIPRILNAIATVVRDKPARDIDFLAGREQRPQQSTQSTQALSVTTPKQKAARSKVVRMRPRVHAPLPQDIRRSKGISK